MERNQTDVGDVKKARPYIKHFCNLAGRLLRLVNPNTKATDIPIQKTKAGSKGEDRMIGTSKEVSPGVFEVYNLDGKLFKTIKTKSPDNLN